MKKFFYPIFIILVLDILLLPVFVVAETADKTLSPPGSWDQIGGGAKKIINFFPQTLKAIWRGVTGVWLKMATFFDNIWDEYIWSKIEWIWGKILGIFGKEAEKRKEAIPGELEKEKQEVKEEAQKSGKGIWQKIKDIVPGI